MRRIFAIVTDGAACALYRMHWPLARLNPDLFQVIWNPPTEDWIRRPGDIVIGQRIAGYNTAWREMCADLNLTAIYDLDDNLLDLDPSNTVPYSIYHPQADDTAINIEMADLVTVSTPKLAEQIRPINPRVVVLPNCLPDTMLSPLPRRTDGGLTIGWAGSMFHGQDWPGVAEQLQDFMGHHTHARLHLIGANYAPGLPARVTGWSTMEHYWQSLDFDIGIAPISKTPFNDAKSFCKVLEYGARGIPAVATNWGQYPDFIADGVNGYLIDDISELSNRLQLLTDGETRAQMSTAAFEKAQEYKIDSQIHRWEAAYLEA